MIILPARKPVTDVFLILQAVVDNTVGEEEEVCSERQSPGASDC